MGTLGVMCVGCSKSDQSNQCGIFCLWPAYPFNAIFSWCDTQGVIGRPQRSAEPPPPQISSLSWDVAWVGREGATDTLMCFDIFMVATASFSSRASSECHVVLSQLKRDLGRGWPWREREGKKRKQWELSFLFREDWCDVMAFSCHSNHSASLNSTPLHS